MKVSVCMLTYNHQDYIVQAIEGVLMQECEFDIELIIADDYSQDNTDFIIQNILISHPKSSVINYIRHEKNLGMIPNFIFALQKCAGEYIAICEGDDYWTDPLKLQKQVDFLANNLEYTICFHRVKVLTNGVLESDTIIESRYDKIEKLPATVADLVWQGNFIHTPSVMFRNQLQTFPNEFLHSTVGDYFLYIILSEKGYIKRLDDIMAVYRNNVGIYSSLSAEEMNVKIAIYQSCLLSYLADPELKEVVLKKQIALLNNTNTTGLDEFMKPENLYKKISIRDLKKMLMLKFKNLL